jgi:AAA domain
VHADVLIAAVGIGVDKCTGADSNTALHIATVPAPRVVGDVSSAAVLTPYKGQVRALEAGLRALSPWFSSLLGELDLTVSSVDGYQGREADVVVFSGVRCNSAGRIGFLADRRRLNVALTRPRRGLVVVCSPETLAAGSLDWRAFVDEAMRHGVLVGPEALPVAPWQAAGISFDPFQVHDGSDSSRGS